MKHRWVSAIILLLGIVTTALAGQPSTRPATIDERLALPIESISLDGLKLADALLKIAEQTHLNLVPDWPSLSGQVDLDAQHLQGTFRNLSVKQVILIACTMAGAERPLVVVEDEQVRIAGEPFTQTRVIAVGPHLIKSRTDQLALMLKMQPAGTSSDPLEKLLISAIDPESWSVNGGTIGTVDFLLDHLVVRQTPENLAKIEKFLKQMEADLAR